MMEWSKRGNINIPALVTIVQCNTLVARCSQLIGPADWFFLSQWDPYAMISLEAVAYNSYCNTVEWFWWDWSLSQWPTGFLQCFDAVGWVIWPVKIVSEMTYKVSSGTLSFYAVTPMKVISSSQIYIMHRYKQTDDTQLISAQVWQITSESITWHFLMAISFLFSPFLCFIFADLII